MSDLVTGQGIALFGASGRTGRCVIDEAASRGLDVRGLVRTAGALSGTPATEVVGSFESDSAVDATLEGCSAVDEIVKPRFVEQTVFVRD